MLLYQNLSIYYTWKKHKKSYKNNKFKISAPLWNEEFELPDESYSVSLSKKKKEIITDEKKACRFI